MEYRIKGKFKITLLVFSILLIVFLSFLMCKCFSETEKDNLDYSFREELIMLSSKVDYSKLNLKIEDKEIETELVFSQQAKAQGLSNRPSLEEGEAMLFIMDENSRPSFVMREMNFPLDLVFINNAVVQKVFHKAEPEGEVTKETYSYGPADMVLELPGGYFLENDLSIGSRINIVK